jgi:hypothetical protein
MRMTMMLSPVRDAFDQFQRNVDAAGAAAALLDLRTRLAAERAAYAAETWRSWCADAADHPGFGLLLQDPYSRDARGKPAGYAGDARTLDYVYLRDHGEQPISPLGRALFSVSTGVPIAEAVRERSRHLTKAVHAVSQAAASPTVVSIACGHARELDQLPAETIDAVHFWGVDQDGRSVEAARSRWPRCTFEIGSVRAILQGSARLPECSLVYASGLFDYLDDRTAAILIKRMFASVRPGGRVLVANLTPANDEIAFMEAVMDWWMHYRDKEALADLIPLARIRAEECQSFSYTTSENRVAWLQIQRLA